MAHGVPGEWVVPPIHPTGSSGRAALPSRQPRVVRPPPAVTLARRAGIGPGGGGAGCGRPAAAGVRLLGGVLPVAAGGVASPGAFRGRERLPAVGECPARTTSAEPVYRLLVVGVSLLI